MEPTPEAIEFVRVIHGAVDRGAEHVAVLMLEDFASRRVAEKDTEIAALKQAVLDNFNQLMDRGEEIAALRAQVEWRPIETAPSGWFNFFLVRPKGIHPGNGNAFLPTVVQYVDGEFYSPDNEIEPLYFGQREQEGHPLKTELEWCLLPAPPDHTIPTKGDAE